jgi:DNA-binding transcriptional MerR regulator
MRYSVGEVARLTGVSIRTLHHYDEIGLLRPSARTEAGHRRYGDGEIERLHKILVYRELGFGLSAITTILDDRAVPEAEHLVRQRDLLEKQVARLTRMIRGVERIMASKKSGLNLTPAEMKRVFGDFDPTEYEQEVEGRWGDTDAYRESQRRAARYGEEDWQEIRAEAERIGAGFVEAMAGGTDPSDEAAMELAEEHRRHITRWFYPCSYEIHRGLAEMYVADPRFAKHYEVRAPGLAVYVRDAILANAARAS